MTTFTLLTAATISLGVIAVAVVRLDSPAPPPAELVFTGLCDASAGLLLDANHLLVANDEDRTRTELRLYDLRAPGAPVSTIDATAALAPVGDDTEVDLEGLTRFGPRFALIGSHSRSGDEGADAPNRRRLLAFELAGTSPRLELAKPGLYTTFVEDAQAFLATQPDPLATLVLDKKVGAKDGGLSIEALGASAAPGELLIGLRSPLLPDGRAIVLAMTNAAAVLDSGAKPAFGPPILLSLGKQGLRDLVSDGRGGYLLLAGNAGEGGTFALWSWAGPTSTAAPRKMRSIANDADTSAEGLVVAPDAKTAWILFDEGERKMPSGKKCKGNSVPATDKSFRARRITLPAR